MFRLYDYVGPDEIREAAANAPPGEKIGGKGDLDRAAKAHAGETEEAGLWLTYVISESGELIVAPRRSEHVACAGGRPVRGAGELRIAPEGGIDAISNLSTGYCPDFSSWAAVKDALDRAGLGHPD